MVNEAIPPLISPFCALPARPLMAKMFFSIETLKLRPLKCNRPLELVQELYFPSHPALISVGNKIIQSKI